MKEILHQLKLAVYPIIDRVLYIAGPRWLYSWMSSINSTSLDAWNQASLHLTLIPAFDVA